MHKLKKVTCHPVHELGRYWDSTSSPLINLVTRMGMWHRTCFDKKNCWYGRSIKSGKSSLGEAWSHVTELVSTCQSKASRPARSCSTSFLEERASWPTSGHEDTWSIYSGKVDPPERMRKALKHHEALLAATKPFTVQQVSGHPALLLQHLDPVWHLRRTSDSTPKTWFIRHNV